MTTAWNVGSDDAIDRFRRSAMEAYPDFSLLEYLSAADVFIIRVQHVGGQRVAAAISLNEMLEIDGSPARLLGERLVASLERVWFRWMAL